MVKRVRHTVPRLVKLSVFLVPFGVLALVLGGCSPSNEGNNAASETPAAENSASSNEATSNSAIVPSASSTPLAATRATLLSSVWVPGTDEKLHLKPVSKSALDAQKKFGDPTAALADVVRMSPKFFPPKTRVLDFHDDGKTVSVNLSRDFEDPKFWSKAGEMKTQMAVYALVNTAASSSGNKAVVLKTDNRPLSALGEFDASDAIEPDPKMQAGSAGQLGGA